MPSRVLPLLLLLGCNPEPVPPVAPEPPPAPPADASDPLVRWAGFFEDRFGSRPHESWSLDLDGDGRPELLARIGDSLLRFADTEAAVPSSWDLVRLPVEVGWVPGRAIEVPGLVGMAPAADVLRVPGVVPLVIYWQAGSFAWHQPMPPELQAAASGHPLRPADGSNRRIGDEAWFSCPDVLTEHLLGDFDRDGAAELVVLEVEGGQEATLRRYRPGVAEPDAQSVDYPGCRALPVPNTRREVHGIEEDAPSVLEGDLIEMWLPEKSSVLLDWRGKRWSIVWTSD